MKKIRGVTLLEVLLVMAILASVMVMLVGYVQQTADETRRDRATLQVQQILNATLAYYVNTSTWPAAGDLDGTSLLQTGGYLPTTVLKDPWGGTYHLVGTSASGTVFTIQAPSVPSQAEAQILAGRLPLAAITGPTAGKWTVSASVPMPGQNLNNARSVNFAGIYHSGACVPAPVCPGNMKAAIYVAAVGVSGVNDPPTGCTNTTWNASSSKDPNSANSLTGCTANVYPVSSFTAWAKGDATGKPTASNPGPLDCATTRAPVAMQCDWTYTDQGGQLVNNAGTPDPVGTNYWRVCLNVITEKGQVYAAGSTGTFFNYQQGAMMGSVMAVTRCVPNNGSESPSGSSFAVWGINSAGSP